MLKSWIRKRTARGSWWRSRKESNSEPASIPEDVACSSSLAKKQSIGRSRFNQLYCPLEQDEIRVVILAPGTWDDPVNCSFQYGTIDSSPYEALSYCWGPPDQPRERISLQGHEIEITASLYSVLRHLRSPVAPRIMWIDQICINQDDDLEKGSQVGKMRDIYSKTEHVLAWLGEESDNSGLAVDLVRMIGPELRAVHLDLEKISWLQTEEFDPRPWVAFSKLIRRLYFSRLWVAQEICLPQKLISAISGNDAADFDEFMNLTLALPRYDWSPRHWRSLSDAGYMDGYPPRIRIGVNRSHWQGLNLRAGCTLSNQIQRFRDFECQLPQDKVFGLLGMCVDIHMLSPMFKADYTVPPAIIFCRAAHYIISTTRKLSLLGFAQSYGRTIDSPSRAPDWTIPEANRPGARFAEVGNSKFDDNEYLYNATSNSEIDVPIFRNATTLLARGTIIANISIVGSSNLLSGQATLPPGHVTVSGFPALFLQWYEMAQQRAPTRSQTNLSGTDIFLQMMIANREMDKKMVVRKAKDEQEGRQFRQWMKELLNDGHQFPFDDEDLQVTTDTKEPPSGRESISESSSDPLSESLIIYFRRAWNTSYCRRFFIANDGSMGLAPADAAAGDAIALIIGFNVPFVLRDRGDGTYQIIGECYLHGTMDGEATEDIEAWNRGLREIALT